MGVMNLDLLRELGERTGLHGVGIAPAIDEVRAAYPWARSVVCAAVSYLPPERPAPQDGRPRGLVARFARGADYHVVLRAKLAPLAEAVTREGGRAEVCVDTCSLPERKLAVLAGTAWRGKNGCVFVEGCGSYVALGEIVTDLELPAGIPNEFDGCGECRRCMDACPAGAITAPYTVDRARCLSQVTQSGGPIPDDVKAKLGLRIYGCDTCQEACPHNQDMAPITPEFAQEIFPGAYPELAPLIDLSPQDFRERVRPSSIGWIGRSRIRRNATIAAESQRYIRP